jgi:hypothetical protein
MNNHQGQGRSPPTGNADISHYRQPFHNPHTALGATGHWIKTLGILSPLLIGEFVPDQDQRWRYTRIAAIATAALSQGLYMHRIQREREERDQRQR